MKNKTTKSLSAITLALLLTTACSENKTAEQYVVEAQKVLETGGSNQAIIELKNALKKDPSNIEARYLLGKVYLEVGQSLSAEKELRKALELGGDKSKLVPLLAEVLMFNADYDAVIELADSNLAEKTLESILPLQAIALSYLSKLNDKPYLIYKLIENDNAEHQYLGQVLKAIHEKKGGDHTLKTVSQLAEINESLETWFLLGKLFLHYEQFDEAIESFYKYQNGRESDLRSSLYIAQGAAAKNDIELAKKLSLLVIDRVPNQPLANQIAAYAYYNESVFDKAVFYIDKAIQNGLSNDTTRLIAAMSHFFLDNYESSYTHFNKIQHKLEENHPARKVMVLNKLKLGLDSEAVDNILEMGDTANDILISMGNKYIKSEDKKELGKLISKIDGVGSESIIDLGRVGLFKVYLNDWSGIQDIEKKILEQPNDKNYRVLLISSLIYKKDLPKALSETEKLIALDPEYVIAYNLAGSLAFKLSNLDLANKYFDKALKLEPKNYLTFMYRASKAEQLGDYETAFLNINEALNTEHKTSETIHQLYKMAKRTNQVDSVINKVIKRITIDNANIDLTLLLAGIYFEEKRFIDVVEVLSSLKIEQDYDSSYWVLLGDSYIQLNRFEKAVEVFQSWSVNKPNNITALQRQLFVLDHLERFNDALKLIDSLLADNIDNESLNMIKAYFLIQNNNYIEGNKLLLTLRGSNPENVTYNKLKGLAEVGLGNCDKGLNYLNQVYLESPTSKVAQAIYYCLDKIGKKQKGIEFLTLHTSKYPEDFKSNLLLGAFFFTSDVDKAIKYNELALKHQPGHPIILNNLAWLYLTNGKADKAETYSKEALKQHPTNIDFLDTYAQVLIQNKKLDLALNIYEGINKERKLSSAMKISYVKALMVNNQQSLAQKLANEFNINDEQLKD